MNVNEASHSSDPGQPIRQTLHPRSDWEPNWSPDGRHLVYTSNRYDSSQEIYMLSVANKTQGNFDRSVTRLTNHPENNDNLPAWSPDGKRIAFSSYREENWDIYVLDVEDLPQGTVSDKLTRLTIHPDNDLAPTWSPDGTRLAFTHVEDTNGNGYLDGQDTGEIYMMNADGSNMIRLTDNLANEGGPAWSPDGTRIAFWSTRDANQEIYVMNADGSGQMNLSNHLAKDTHPTWSPDSRRLAFVSDRDGNDEIYLMNADGSGQTNLTHNPAQDQDPAWGP
jgi:Tol biopolymer transport system component